MKLVIQGIFAINFLKLNKNVASKDKTIASQQAEIDSYRRRDIFRSAGLDPNRKDVQYMMKAYDGELDIDAVREEASLAGFLREDSFDKKTLVIFLYAKCCC